MQKAPLRDKFEACRTNISTPFLKPASTENFAYTVIKYLIVGVLLFPIRLLLGTVATVLCVTLARLSIVGLGSDTSTPLSRLCFFVIGMYHIKRTGHQNMDTTIAPIVVANHVSYIDPFLLCIEYGPVPISATDLLKYPFVNGMILAMRSILVDRNSNASKDEAKTEILKRAALAYKDNRWNPLLIFPEGTCTNGEALIRFKPGAFYGGFPVQPVCVKYPDSMQEVAWTKETLPLVARIFKLMMQFQTNVEIQYLPVYLPNEKERKDPFLYAANVRKVMARALKVPMTDHSYEDARLILLSSSLNCPGATEDLLFCRLREQFGFDLPTLQDLLREYAFLKKVGGGTNHKLTEGFSEFLQARCDFGAGLSSQAGCSRLTPPPAE